MLSASFLGWPPYEIPLAWLFAARHGLAEESHPWLDLRQPLGTLGLWLGDHLVTKGVHIKPQGAMEHQLSPASGAHWDLPKRRFGLCCTVVAKAWPALIWTLVPIPPFSPI